VLVNEGKGRYAWVTLGPLAFLGTTTLTGGFLSIRDIFLPLWRTARTRTESFNGLLDAVLTTVMMGCVVMILVDALPRWLRSWRTGNAETLARLKDDAETAMSLSGRFVAPPGAR
jgi:carbon starvation protein